MNNSAYPVARTIVDRRTIRRYKPDPLPEQLVERLLNTAVWAPTHGLREPWRFILFVAEGRRRLIDAVIRHALKPKNADRLLEVPAYLAVVIREDSRPRELEEDMLAGAALVQNIQLAAWEQGVGVKWLTEPYTFRPQFRADIGVSEGEKLIGLLQLGYPLEVPSPAPRTPAERKLTVVRD